MALTDDLIAYWAMNGNSNDSLGSFNGTDTNISYTTGLINQSASFNGGSSDILLGNSSTLQPTAFSVNVWVKYTSTSAEKLIFCLQDVLSSPYNGMSIATAIGSGAKISAYLGSTSNGYVTTTSNVNTGGWIMVTVSFSSGTHTIYVNASQEAQNTSKTLTWASPNKDLRLGRYSNYGGGYFNGYLCEVGYWSRALTGSEITELYNSGAGLTYPFSTSTSHIKSADGILLANIKSADGILLANIKSADGVTN